MRNPLLSILVFGIALLLVGYFLKIYGFVNNNITAIIGLVFIAYSLAKLVYNGIKKPKSRK